MARSRSFRRHKRWVKIKKRLDFLKRSVDVIFLQPGRYAKYNLTCDCKICKLGRERYSRHGRRKDERYQLESELKAEGIL